MRFNAYIVVKKIILILILVSGAVLIFRYVPYSFSGDDLEKHLKEWEVGINAAGFKLTDFSESRIGGLAKEMLEAELNLAAAEDEHVILQMTKITTAVPQKYIDDKKFLLESLFLPTTSPYPGVITNIRECPEEFKPKVQDHENGSVYTFFAGSQFNYGVCAQDLVEYSSAYGIFDCKEKGIFEVRVFFKGEEVPKSMIQSFTC